MTFAFEVDPDLDSETGMHGETFVGDYEEFFEEDEFSALAVNPAHPTEAKPGSEDKVLMLAARYAAGMPLWHDGDCYDHGPSGALADDDRPAQDEEEDD